MKKISDLLDRYFMPAFRWLTLGACIVVALNQVAFWWHWEVRLPAWGAIPDNRELMGARLVLFHAAASLAMGAALFDLLKVPVRLRRYAILLFATALILAAMPNIIGLLKIQA